MISGQPGVDFVSSDIVANKTATNPPEEGQVSRMDTNESCIFGMIHEVTFYVPSHTEELIFEVLH